RAARAPGPGRARARSGHRPGAARARRCSSFRRPPRRSPAPPRPPCRTRIASLTVRSSARSVKGVTKEAPARPTSKGEEMRFRSSWTGARRGAQIPRVAEETALEEGLALDRWGLRFVLPATEDDYRIWRTRSLLSFMRIGVVLSLITYGAASF